jgi:hypothetical protein
MKLTEKGSYFSYANYPLIICKLGKNFIGDWLSKGNLFMKIGRAFCVSGLYIMPLFPCYTFIFQTVPISFKFLFYGHMVQKITIATGGMSFKFYFDIKPLFF